MKKKKKKEKKKTKKKKGKHFGRLAAFQFGTFAMFLAPLGVLFVMYTLEDEQQVVTTAYKLAVSEILRDSFVLADIMRQPTL